MADLNSSVWQSHLILTLGHLTRTLLRSGEVRARVVVLHAVGKGVWPALKKINLPTVNDGETQSS